MSEYQCYEFVALDRPLSPKQIAELRQISTRADVTPTRFWNEYDWGDLKADPAKLLERYFDAHMYRANWGTRRLMLRLPIGRVDAESLRAYFVGGAATAKVVRDHLVLDLRCEEEEPAFDEETEGSLSALAPVRAELMRGDLRGAYLAWLLAVQAGDVENEDVEPDVPPGLRDLTAAQAAMVAFLRIDDDLVAAAAGGSATEIDDGPAVRRWALGLTARAKDTWILRAIDEPDVALGGEILRAYRAETMPVRRSGGRTVADLRAAAERRRARRERAAAERARKAKKAAEDARDERLDTLATRLDAAWRELEALVEKSAYEDAIKLAVDLRDLASRDDASAAFAARFEAMRRRQLRRRAFFDRWRRVGVTDRASAT
jgi:hypothetical protein